MTTPAPRGPEPHGDVVVVLNRRSRRTSSVLSHLRELLRASGISVAAFHVAADHDEVHALVKRAAKAGAHAVLAGGGDGTMAQAVDALAYRDTVLGVIPLGTGNSFARSIGLDPHDVDAAVHAIAAGSTARIDLGNANGTYFANFATIGLSSDIARATARRLKHWSGSVAYAISAIGPLRRHRAFRARIRWNGGRLDVCTHDIIVANGRYFGAPPIAPDATVADGHLTLFVNAGTSALGALRTYAALLRGNHDTLAGAHVVSAPSFAVRAAPKQRIALDGTPFEKTAARLRVAPGALRVFVPSTGVAHA